MAQRAGRRTRKHRYSFVTQSGFLSSESNALLRGVCFGSHFGRDTLTYGMFRDIYITWELYFVMRHGTVGWLQGSSRSVYSSAKDKTSSFSDSIPLRINVCPSFTYLLTSYLTGIINTSYSVLLNCVL